MPARGRTCVGCRRVWPKTELTRMVRSANGSVAVDPHGTTPGRGAYVCRDDAACADRARKRLPGALRARR